MTKPDISFEDKVRAYIRENMLLPEEKVLVIAGLSGGADSVALAAVLARLGYPLIAVHCNFHLRGKESDRDMNHSAAVASKLGIELIVEHFDIEAWRKENGGSIEMACRETRYQAFERIRVERGGAAVAVAHHREDNLETILHNLMRGTGIAGLTGMSPKNGKIIRPLLGMTRKAIENYLGMMELDYVDDSTNFGNEYARNRIRNIVVPAMLEANENAVNGILTTSEILSETEVFYREALENEIENFIKPEGVDLRGLSEKTHGDLILYEYLRTEGVSRQMANDMIASADHSGRRFKSGFKEWVNDHGLLREAGGERGKKGINSDFPFEIDMIERGEMAPCRDATVAYLDAGVGVGNLSWRYWKKGDRMKPFGMNGSKKVSDLMRDAHVGTDRKSIIPILIDHEDNILFIPGIRASRLYQVTPQTTEILRIKIKKGGCA